MEDAYEGIDEDDLDEEEMEQLNEDLKRNRKKVPIISQSKKTRKAEPKKEKEVKRRFTAFYQPERMGIVDAETGEIITEYIKDIASEDKKTFALFEAQAITLENQERIENTIGNLLSG